MQIIFSTFYRKSLEQTMLKLHDTYVLFWTFLSQVNNNFFCCPGGPLKGTRVIRGFWVISIVIDFGGHSYQCSKKNQITMKIEPVTCIWMFVYAMNFELPEMAKKWSFGLFRPNLPQLGLFHLYFVSKSSFRVIKIIKMIIWDQSKPISLYLKIKK